MISIHLDEPKALKDNILISYSAFITFNYDPMIVKYMQDLSIRSYDPADKSWEIPVENIINLCNTFSDQEIVISGKYVEIKDFNQLVEIPEDYVFKVKPFTHQLDGIKFGLSVDKFILGDQQGLGKTAEIIHLASCRKDVKHCLIICGVNSIKYNWQEEIAFHSNEKSMVLGSRKKRDGSYRDGSFKEKMEDLNNLPDDVKFIITNIETIRAGVIKTYKERNGRPTKVLYNFPIADKLCELCDNDEIQMIAFDEAHKCRNTGSQQGQAMLQLHSKYMIAATGTPLVNNPLDLFFPLKWLGYENGELFTFQRQYCVMGGFNKSEILGYKNLDNLKELLHKIMIRRLKEEVLDLPEKIHTTQYIDMTPNQAKIYGEVQQNLRDHLNVIIRSNNPLGKLIRLRQATDYTGLISDEIKESAKLDRMKEIVDELVLNDQKCIIYSEFVEVVKIVKDMLKDYNPACIIGEVAAADRRSEVDRFQTDPDCKVMVGTGGAMGTGLTMTAAQTVIFLDSPWARVIKDQYEDRAHRIGTKGTVNIITLVCKNTIDEAIENLVYKKGVMADSIVDNKNPADTKKFVETLIG